jgi:glycosyltransferase involved in cell wall biosynthesis
LLISGKLDGIGWFTFETLRRIVHQHPEHDFFFFFDRPFSEEFVFVENVYPVVLTPKARHPLAFLYWFEVSVKKALKALKCDLFLTPDGYASLRTDVPTLSVIHDLNFEHYPADLPFHIRKFYRTMFPLYARKADRLVTVSEFSKGDICEQYGISPSKIDVVHNGVNESFAPISENEKEGARKQFADGKHYFVFVGSLHPRKNISRLFKAFDEFSKSSEEDIRLVIVGEKYYWNTEMKSVFEMMEFSDRVMFSGRLSADDLKIATAAALSVVYVPYFEGFGIPILEGFKCGVPVITSNVTSMPEVAGDAALLADPFDVDSIAEAMRKVATISELREELIAKGNERVKDFSWDQTADQLWTSIEKLARQKNLL